jgi:hypothetical protein
MRQLLRPFDVAARIHWGIIECYQQFVTQAVRGDFANFGENARRQPGKASERIGDIETAARKKYNLRLGVIYDFEPERLGIVRAWAALRIPSDFVPNRHAALPAARDDSARALSLREGKIAG